MLKSTEQRTSGNDTQKGEKKKNHFDILARGRLSAGPNGRTFVLTFPAVMAQPYQKVELKRFAKAHTVDTSESSFWKKFRVRLRKPI